MAGKKCRVDITPVFNHRKSIALVDTAEELVDSLDNLSVCLRHIEERHVQNKCSSESSKGEQSLYKKLKDNLEIAQDLTETLKREKWRLGRRQMSIELRMGELEEYKSHLKRDMTDMNQTVESLSMRVIQLEDALVEAQEIQELTEAEKKVTEKRLESSEETIKDLEEEKSMLEEEIKQLKGERKDTVLKRQHSEISERIEILMLENKSLKELIREKEESENAKTNEEGVNNAMENNKLEDGTTVTCNGNSTQDERKNDEEEAKESKPVVLQQVSEIAYV